VVKAQFTILPLFEGGIIMCRKSIYVVCAVLVLIVATAIPGCATVPITCAAVPIKVENFSFELPGNGKIIGWDQNDGAHYASDPCSHAEVPGWESDGTVTDSGVETGYTPTDGEWTGFLMGTNEGSGDPSVYNLTDHLIQAGDVFELKVDARQTYNATDFKISLYYDNSGTRVLAATTTVVLTDTMQEFTLSFVANDAPASIGHKIGIELANPNIGWVGFDKVRLNNLKKTDKPKSSE
jgi:hypothetical protein